jgi:hypothetical protein
MMVQHYIFGYGSLICSHSRAVTASSDAAQPAAIPVKVSGLERVWSKRSAKLGMTAVGIRFAQDASTVGVLVPVTEADLARFDVREQGYSRVALSLDDVDLLPTVGKTKDAHESSGETQEQGSPDQSHPFMQIWAYVPDEHAPADADHPIVQSYVDTILRGCLDVGGESFAREFLEHTKGWNPSEVLALSDSDSDDDDKPRSSYRRTDSSGSTESSTESVASWIDDRKEPVYIRGDPQHSRKNASNFDRLLRTYTPMEERRAAASSE